jgi:hypothetical protein
MSQLIEQAVEYMPYIGAALGATAGAAIETMAVRKHAQDQEALAAVLADIAQENESSPSLLDRAKRMGAATLFLTGAMAGSFNGLAWQPSASEGMPPQLGVVVDHSGALRTNEEVLQTVNSITELFANDSYDATAYVAANGEVKIVEPEQSASLDAFGDAPLSQAFINALDANKKTKSEALKVSKNQTGIVVITNGNTFGSSDKVIAQAKEQQSPVFIANIEGETDPALVKEFQLITKNTGGAYFNVATDTVDTISKNIEKTLIDSQFKKENSNRWPLRAFASLLGVGALVQGYRNRSKEPTAKRLKK